MTLYQKRVSDPPSCSSYIYLTTIFIWTSATEKTKYITVDLHLSQMKQHGGVLWVQVVFHELFFHELSTRRVLFKHSNKQSSLLCKVDPIQAVETSRGFECVGEQSTSLHKEGHDSKDRGLEGCPTQWLHPYCDMFKLVLMKARIAA